VDVDLAPFDLAERCWEAITLAQDAMAAAVQPGWALAAQYLDDVVDLPGLVSLGAHRDDRLVGALIGFPCASRDWWPRNVRPALKATGNAHWLDGAFELAELHVHPNVQGAGVGTALIESAIEHTSLTHIVLSANVANRRAREFYRRRGFRTLTGPFRWLGTDLRILVMGREIKS
jgi:ribosomal protein S18 acetylase RimI-like enzyme